MYTTKKHKEISHRSNSSMVLCVIVIIAAILILNILKYLKDNSIYPFNISDSYENIGLEIDSQGPVGLGFKKSFPRPLFLDLAPPIMSIDFKLQNTIRKLKMMSNEPTINNGHKRTLLENQISIGPVRNPVFIIPDLGASKVFVKWSKESTETVKRLDSYNNFQEFTKWSCKDTEQNWVPLFDRNISGLARLCYKDLYKTKLVDKDLENQSGVQTEANKLGSLEYSNNEYLTLIEGLYALSYVKSSTLFGVSYDSRLVFSNKYFNRFVEELTSKIEAAYELNLKPIIFIGHGVGSLLTNKFLLAKDLIWKNKYIASFINISGPFGGMPAAFRVLTSGDQMPDYSDQKILRDSKLNNSGLHAVLSLGSDKQLIRFKNIDYSNKDLKNVFDNFNPEMNEVYKLIAEQNSNISDNPNVPVLSIIGSYMDTEDSYISENFNEDPYKTFTVLGDGKVPDYSLKYAHTLWSKSQLYPVVLREYPGAEHSLILHLNEPVSDILSVIKKYNRI